MVVQQHHGTAGHGPRRRQVRGRELRVLHPVGIGQRVGEHARQVFQGQYVAHVVVDGRHADLAAPHEGRPVVRVRGVLAGHLHAHLDVHARGQREPRGIRPACRVPEGFEFLDRLVVADDRAVEPPLVAQDRREQVGVRAGRYAVERVERAHHRRRARVDRCLVGRQVVVAELLLGHVDRVVLTACHGCAVGGEVLHRGGHLVRHAEVAALIAVHLRRRHRRPEEGVLPRAFHHASPARVSGDVHHGVEGPLDPVRGGLAGRYRRVVLHGGRVPAAGLPQRHREDRLVAVDHVQAEDHRDVQARLQGGPLDLVDVFHAHQVKDGADLAAAHLVEECRPRRAVRAGGTGHLKLPEFLRQRHLSDQRADLAGDRRQPLPCHSRQRAVGLMSIAGQCSRAADGG